MRHLPLLLALLVACEAPPTADQVTSRAVKRNCEAQASAAADDLRRQNTQLVKEGNTIDPDEQHRVDTRASEIRERTFRECMLKYSV